MQDTPRIRRMKEVLAQRLGHVCCAVEAVHHRHNISAILRTADALGIHQVHLVTDHFRPSKGAARGSERWLEVTTHQEPSQAIEALKEAGYAIWVADLAEPPTPPEAVPLHRPVCLWFGAELVGVGPKARAAAEGVVTIPMRGFAQSLNVSVAAALTMRPVAERARAQLGSTAMLSEAARAEILAGWVARDANMEDRLAEELEVSQDDGR